MCAVTVDLPPLDISRAMLFAASGRTKVIVAIIDESQYSVPALEEGCNAPHFPSQGKVSENTPDQLLRTVKAVRRHAGTDQAGSQVPARNHSAH